MKITRVADKIRGRADEFFKENCVNVKNYTSGDHNLSVDGTGVDVSVGETVGRRIGEYILKKFDFGGEIPTVIDLGTGKGHLPNEMSKLGINAWGLEGSRNLIPHMVHDKNKMVVCDLSSPLDDQRLYKAFHLTTSFELIEHIHRSHERQFFKNLAYLSDYHLCSINVDGWPGVASNHCNIKHPCCWAEAWRTYGIKYEVLGGAPKAAADGHWREEALIPIEWNKLAHNEEFRDNVRFGQWDEWKFSIFCLLDLSEMYK